MLTISHKLHQVRYLASVPIANHQFVWQLINLFIASADHHYGPITTIQHEGHIVKHIPWSAFQLSGRDWARVIEAAEILAVCDCFLCLISN